MDNLRSITKSYLVYTKENNQGRVVSNINNETVKEFIEHKLESGLSPQSANTYLSELSKMGSNLSALGVSGIDREAISLDIRNYLKDQGHVLGALNKDRTNINGDAMVQYVKENSEFGISADLQKIAGLRVDDALNIADKVSINSDGSLHIIGSKNGRDYNTIPLKEDLLNRVQNAIDNGYKADYQEYRLVLKESAEATGNEWNGTHSLRFDAANDMKDNGMTLSEISQNLGHERQSITLRYLK